MRRDELFRVGGKGGEADEDEDADDDDDEVPVVVVLLTAVGKMIMSQLVSLLVDVGVIIRLVE